MAEIRLLGTVELRVDGRSVKLGSDKVRMLLAALAIDVGKPIALSRLEDLFWDDEPPNKASGSIYSFASRIRNELRKAPGAEDDGIPVLISTHAHTYTLETDPGIIDWHRYLRLTGRARLLAERGDDAEALALLTQAESLWKGEPLAGLPGEWAHVERVRMDAKHLAAAITRSTVELRMGRFTDLVPELSTLVSRYPTDQTLVGHLMLALYGSGRQGEALMRYQGTRRLLLELLGSSPGKELATLHARILENTPPADLVARPTPVAAPNPSAAPPAPSNVPPRQFLVGREKELEELLAASTRPHSRPVLTITGMGGIGKSALAVHAAHRLRNRYPDGQYHLNLRGHSATQEPLTTESALLGLLRLLGISALEIPETHEQRVGLWQTLLSERRCVIILDDVASPGQVGELLPTEAASVILITSRRSLSELPGIHPLSIEALSPDDAVALFQHLVGPARADDRAKIADIVARCSYHPLATEIAATRLKARSSWNLEHLAKRLSSSSRILDELHDAHRDLTPVLNMSYRSLPADQQRAFRLLGLHPGPGFGPHAAAALLDRTLSDTERVLEALIDCHLIKEPQQERYLLHDLLAEFSAALSSRSPQLDQSSAMDRLIAFAIEAVDLADRLLYPHRLRLTIPQRPIRPTELTWTTPSDARAWLTGELAGLLAIEQYAREHGRPDAAAWLTHALGGFLEAEGFWTEALTLHQAARAHWQAVGDQRAEARALIELGGTYLRTAKIPLAQEATNLALHVARAAEDDDGIAEAMGQLGVLKGSTGDFAEALRIQQQAMNISERNSNHLQRDRFMNNAGVMSMYLGTYDSSLELLTEALSGFRRHGNRRLEAKLLSNLGQVYLRQGDAKSARDSFEKCLTLGLSTLSELDRAVAQNNLATTLEFPEEFERACELHETALEVFRRFGTHSPQAATLNALGALHERAALPAAARTWHSDALSLAAAIGSDHERAVALRGLGTSEVMLGHHEAAQEHLEAAANLAHQIQAPLEEARTCVVLAELLQALGRPVDSRALLQRALTIFEQLKAPEASHLRKLQPDLITPHEENPPDQAD